MIAGKKTDAELAALLAGCPAPGSGWRHYRTGRLYYVTECTIDEATLAPRVGYVQWNTGIKFSRPLSEWRELLYTDQGWTPRFTAADSVALPRGTT